MLLTSKATDIIEFSLIKLSLLWVSLPISNNAFLLIDLQNAALITIEGEISNLYSMLFHCKIPTEVADISLWSVII